MKILKFYFFIILTLCLTQPEVGLCQQKDTFTNPIAEGADPWVIEKDGKYYSCGSGKGGIYVSQSTKLTEPGKRIVVWKTPESGWNRSNVWAPELHFLNGKWYIYYAAAKKSGPPFIYQRSGVLESVADNPFGPYEDKGMFYTGDNIEDPSSVKWAIDLTSFSLNGQLYAIWSGWEENADTDKTKQHLYIALMSDHKTISSNRVKLTSPVESWETGGPLDLIEGPQVLRNKSKVFIIYSTRESWLKDYRLGQLALADSTLNPMQPENWVKTGPVFMGTDQVLGVGHCSFAKSPDGTEDWILYHTKKSVEPGWDRKIMLQPFSWKTDGSPDFGNPVPAGEPLPIPSGEEHQTGEEQDGERKYSNPVINKDFADPTAIKGHDGNYYVYATNTDVNGKVVNIQVARSPDLINWETLGDALPQKPSWANEDFWAPHVLYDSTNQTYYLYYSGESASQSQGKCLGVATSKDPAGPFLDKGEPLLCGESFVNIDPMAFDDPATGRKLLYWGSAHQPIKVQELEKDRLSFKRGSTPVKVVNAVVNNDPANYEKLIEGAWVEYYNGYYYLYYSGDNCCGDQAHYAVMVARAKNATGPFETLSQATGKENSVILEQSSRWIAPGHNSIITDAAGQDWMVYHAIDSAKRNEGRVMLMDKITYEGGWPVIQSGKPSVREQEVPVVE